MIKLLRFIPLLLILLLFISVKSFNTRIARLTIDYGPRSIGIAHSNYFGIVEPYGVVRNERDQVIVANKILDLARMWSVSEIILGVPLDSNGILNYGVKNFNGQLCLNFSKVLSATSENLYPGKFKTNLFDERYTTKEAQLRLKLDKVTGSCDSCRTVTYIRYPLSVQLLNLALYYTLH